MQADVIITLPHHSYTLLPGHEEYNIVNRFKSLREAFQGSLCFCDEKGIRNLEIVVMYRPDLCLEGLR